jgi:hypothetical protein
MRDENRSRKTGTWSFSHERSDAKELVGTTENILRVAEQSAVATGVHFPRIGSILSCWVLRCVPIIGNGAAADFLERILELCPFGFVGGGLGSSRRASLVVSAHDEHFGRLAECAHHIWPEDRKYVWSVALADTAWLQLTDALVKHGVMAGPSSEMAKLCSRHPLVESRWHQVRSRMPEAREAALESRAKRQKHALGGF